MAITVTDTGIGMTESLLSRVFELFTQGDTTADRAQGGLGIGLALAKRLTELHGGAIEAHSDGPGRGSEFIVRLPLSKAAVAAEQTALARIAARAQPGAHHRRQPRRGDDDGDVRRGAGRHGVHGVRRRQRPGRRRRRSSPTSSSWTSACRVSTATKCAAASVRCRRQQQVVLVAVTGWGQAQDKQRALDVGFDAHLTKPVDPDALAQLLAGAAV